MIDRDDNITGNNMHYSVLLNGGRMMFVIVNALEIHTQPILLRDINLLRRHSTKMEYTRCTLR